MIRLLYFSQATQVITDEQVQDILQSSRRNNPIHGITGVLVHGSGLFMQVLEGPEQKALRQYVKMLDDKRHSNCQIIHISPANERVFGKWSMGIIDHWDPLGFEHIMELHAQRLEAVQPKAFTDTMQAFIRMLNAG